MRCDIFFYLATFKKKVEVLQGSIVNTNSLIYFQHRYHKLIRQKNNLKKNLFGKVNQLVIEC